MPSDHANKICGPPSMVIQPDQTEVEDQTEASINDEDSIMEDVANSVVTRTTSIAPSYSQAASDESTRASTPTEIRAGDTTDDHLAHSLFQNDNDADDVTMKDPNQKQDLQAGVRDKFDNSKVESWPSSPWKAQKPQEESMDYDNPEDLFNTNDPDAPRLYKP